MKFIVLGANGQLGSELKEKLNTIPNIIFI